MLLAMKSIIPSTDVIQLTLTLKMTTAQVVETSVTVNNNSPSQDYVHPDDQIQPTFKLSLKQPLPTEFKVEPTATLPLIVELQLFAVVVERSCCYLTWSLTINK